MYRIYYTHDGEITTIGVADQLGEYIECDLDTMLKLQESVHLYKIEDKKIVKKTLEASQPARKFNYTDQPPGWVCNKDNLFDVIEYATITPDWFDNTKHSWVKYD